MVGVVKWLRQRIVIPSLAGSTPVTHPIVFFSLISSNLALTRNFTLELQRPLFRSFLGS